MPHNWQGLYDLQMILSVTPVPQCWPKLVLNEPIQNIDSCMKTNTELSVNIHKTNYVIFQSKQLTNRTTVELLIVISLL